MKYTEEERYSQVDDTGGSGPSISIPRGIASVLRYLYDEKDPNNLINAAWNTAPKFTETETKTNEPKHQWSYSEDAKLPGFDLNHVKQERRNKNRKKRRK